MRKRIKNDIIIAVSFLRGVDLEQKKTIFVTEKEKQRQQLFSEKCAAVLQERYPEHPPLCYVHSYGCQGNVADGEKIKGILASIGFGTAVTPDEADLVIYNTCAVRENAENHVFGNVGELKKRKQRNKNLMIGLCGCMVQQQAIADKIKRSYPYVDLVFGTHVLHHLPELLYAALTDSKRVFSTPDMDGVIVEDLPVQRESAFKASVPIMYGCNNFCTYCIVPYVRGRERSRKPEDILHEVEDLVSNGYKEILLLGQNVNSYGKTLESPISFSELLRRINRIPGDFRIRFMTSHPKDATRELIDTMAECDKVCHHLHLPVQSGNNHILKMMNRHYTAEQYLDLAEYAKSKIPDLSLTTDVIVGFPGETYEEFLDTVKLLQKVRYDSMFNFIYSKRPGTKAAEMKDPVSHQEKTQWLRQLIAAQNEISDQNFQMYIGKEVRVLVDGFAKSGMGRMTGRTQQNMVVDIDGLEESAIGQFVNVKIKEAKRLALIGTVVK